MAPRRRIRAGLRQGAVRFVAGNGCGGGLAGVRVAYPTRESLSRDVRGSGRSHASFVWRVRVGPGLPRVAAGRRTRPDVTQGVPTARDSRDQPPEGTVEGRPSGPALARHVRRRKESGEPGQRDSTGTRRQSVRVGLHPHRPAVRLCIPRNNSSGPRTEACATAIAPLGAGQRWRLEASRCWSSLDSQRSLSLSRARARRHESCWPCCRSRTSPAIPTRSTSATG